MKKFLALLFFAATISAAPLTSVQLDFVRQEYARRLGVPVAQTKVVINTAAQNVQTWIDANRANLPNVFQANDLTNPQLTQVSAAIGPAFTNGQKAVLFNCVAYLNRILVVVIPPEEDPLVIQTIRDRMLSLFEPDIDGVRPGMTKAQKVRAIQNALGL
jgi:hypothetical protein